MSFGEWERKETRKRRYECMREEIVPQERTIETEREQVGFTIPWLSWAKQTAIKPNKLIEVRGSRTAIERTWMNHTQSVNVERIGWQQKKTNRLFNTVDLTVKIS